MHSQVEPTLLTNTVFIYRVIFFNWASLENVSRLAPPKNALTATFDSEYQLKINFTGT